MEDLSNDDPVMKSLTFNIFNFLDRLIVLLFVVDVSIEMVYFNERFYIYLQLYLKEYYF